MRTIILVLLMPLAVYGSAIGYLKYKVSDNADKLARAASPYATITYGSTYTSILGDEIGLNDITISPTMTQDTFRIERIALTAPHIGYFLNAKNSLESRKIPENIGVTVSRLEVDIGSEIFQMLEAMKEQAASNAPGGSGNDFALYDAAACGDKKRFAISDYQRMGLGTVISDIAFFIRYDDHRNRLSATMDFSADDLYSMNVVSTLDGIPQTMDPSVFADAIAKTNIRYRDRGYYRLRNEYCAELSGSSVEEYISRHTAMVQTLLGADFPQPTLTAYQNYMLEGGTVSIDINPVQNIRLEDMQYYPPKEVVRLMGLEVDVKGEPVDWSGVTWRKTRGSSPTRDAKGSGPGTTGEPRTLRRPRSQRVPEKSTPTYHPIAIDELGKHKGRMTEITLYSGRTRKGVLGRISDGTVRIIIKNTRGTMSFPVKLSDISKVRVLY